MTVIDLSDPSERAKAIAAGYIWSGPAGAQEAACQDIAAGRMPQPEQMPDYARARVDDIRRAAQPDPDQVVPDESDTGWACPLHGMVDLVVLTSKRTSQPYRACRICMQFERPAEGPTT